MVSKYGLSKMKHALSKGSKVHDYKARQRNDNMWMIYEIHCCCAKLNSTWQA